MSDSGDLAAKHARLFERRHQDIDALLADDLIPLAEASGDQDRLIEALALQTFGHFNRREWDEVEDCASRALELFNSGPSTVDPIMIMAVVTTRTGVADRPGSEARFYELSVEALELAHRVGGPLVIPFVNVGFAALALGDISLALANLIEYEPLMSQRRASPVDHPALSDLIASLLASQGYWDQAIEPYRQMLESELPPSHELATLNTLALFGVLAEDPELVEWASSKADAPAERLGPEQAELVLTEAAAALGRGDPEAAVQLLNDLDVSAGRTTAASDRLWLMTLGYGRSGRLDEALDAAREWLALESKPVHRLGFGQSMFDLLVPRLVQQERWDDARELATEFTTVLTSSRIDPLVSLHLFELASGIRDVDGFADSTARQIRLARDGQRLDQLARTLTHDSRGSLQVLELAGSLMVNDPPEPASPMALKAARRASNRLRISAANTRVMASEPPRSHDRTGMFDPIDLASMVVEECRALGQDVSWAPGRPPIGAISVLADSDLAVVALRSLMVLPVLYTDGQPAHLSARVAPLGPDRFGVSFELEHGAHVRSEPGRLELALDPRLSQHYAPPTGEPVGMRPIEVLRIAESSLGGTFDLKVGPDSAIATLAFGEMISEPVEVT